MFKNYLTEGTLLNSQFTFGFEYEGFWDEYQLPDDYDEIKDFVSDIATKHFNLTGKAYVDSSITPNNDDLQGEEECGECYGHGTQNCSSCNDGVVDCGTCEGTGREKCEECEGEGKIDCETCGGDGEIEDSNGDKSECPDCEGDGKIDCKECDDGEIDCRNCEDSSGRVYCSECNGSGRENCEYCGGSGTYENEDVLNSHRFEYACFPMPATPENFNKSVEFIKECKEEGIETNSSCGFHVHIGLPKDFYKDNYAMWMWFILQVALNDKYYKLYTKYFESFFIPSTVGDGKKVEFYDSHYAKNVIVDVRKRFKSYTMKNFDELIKDIFTPEKYQSFRLHPQGTLEWRGPRNFLNTPHWTSFFTKTLPQMITFVNTVVDSKELHLYDTIFQEGFVKDLQKEHKGTISKTITFNQFEKILAKATKEIQREKANTNQRFHPIKSELSGVSRFPLIKDKEINNGNKIFDLPQDTPDGKYVVKEFNGTDISIYNVNDKIPVDNKHIEMLGTIDVIKGKFKNFKPVKEKTLKDRTKNMQGDGDKYHPVQNMPTKIQMLDEFPELKTAIYKNIVFQVGEGFLQMKENMWQPTSWSKGKIPDNTEIKGGGDRKFVIENAQGKGLKCFDVTLQTRGIFVNSVFSACDVHIDTNIFFNNCVFDGCDIWIPETYKSSQFINCTVKGVSRVSYNNSDFKEFKRATKVKNLETFIKKNFDVQLPLKFEKGNK